MSSLLFRISPGQSVDTFHIFDWLLILLHQVHTFCYAKPIGHYQERLGYFSRTRVLHGAKSASVKNRRFYDASKEIKKSAESLHRTSVPWFSPQLHRPKGFQRAPDHSSQCLKNSSIKKRTGMHDPGPKVLYCYSLTLLTALRAKDALAIHSTTGRANP